MNFDERKKKDNRNLNRFVFLGSIEAKQNEKLRSISSK